jgi:hypothetical protein
MEGDLMACSSCRAEQEGRDCCHQTQADVLQPWKEEKRENTNPNLLPSMGTKSDPKITIPTKKKVERDKRKLLSLSSSSCPRIKKLTPPASNNIQYKNNLRAY